jgi:diadenosine tetraphosphate (Ap4A) HIT family hydrolase
LHLVVAPKSEIASAWDNPELSAKTFELAAQACKVMQGLELAPWFNIQANGNWGMLPGFKPYFHLHIYGRNRTVNWGKPIVLPQAPKTYHNDPMSEKDRQKLIGAFVQLS